MKTLPKLYSLSSTGALQEWTIEISGDSYRTHHGQVGGKITTTKWFSAKGKNGGKTNSTTNEEQALLEGQRKWDKKVEVGGVEDPKKAKFEAPFLEPMRAGKFADLEKKGKITYPKYAQPKLDGYRSIFTSEGGFSRGGNKWATVQHIMDIFAPVFEKYPNLKPDGELYNHEYHDDFDKIASLIKKEKPNAVELKEAAEKIQFWWYDIGDETLTFKERLALRDSIIKEFKLDPNIIVPVETIFAKDLTELDEAFEWWLDAGFEGQMVRANTKYEWKRTNNLLKRKTFIDEEFKFIEICEGNGNKSGMAGYAFMELGDGRTFRTNIKGKHEFLKDLYLRRQELVGTWATIKFLNWTPKGKPRCPWVIRLRAGKSKD